MERFGSYWVDFREIICWGKGRASVQMERFGSYWLDFREIICWGKGKGNVHPRTGNEGRDGE
jgi:hypothetical protein